jgi:hypothetical protein
MLSHSCGSLTEHYRGIPPHDITAQSNAYREHAEQRGEEHALERRRRNPFADCLAGETPPYIPEIFDRVYDKLARMFDDYPKDDDPTHDWHWRQLGREDKDDMQMVLWGFNTVAFDHLGGGRKAGLQDELYEVAAGAGLSRDYPVDFRENHRKYKDRFELTYRQAQIVQQIMRYLDEDYDPGGEEATPENLAKRTFYYDAYLGRAIPPDVGGPAKPFYQEDIVAYLRSKQQ